MGKMQRRKGYNGELEAKHICEQAGIPVKRLFMSGMYDERSADLEINCRPVSVKRRKNGMDMYYQELEKCDYVLFRADGKKWLKIELWRP